MCWVIGNGPAGRVVLCLVDGSGTALSFGVVVLRRGSCCPAVLLVAELSFGQFAGGGAGSALVADGVDLKTSRLGRLLLRWLPGWFLLCPPRLVAGLG